MQRKLLGIINVDFDAADQLLIICFAFAKKKKKSGNTMKQCISYSYASRRFDSDRREDLYNILIEFAILMKLVRLTKVCLTETYSRIQVGKHLSFVFPIRNGLKQDNLSPLIFNFALEHTIRGAHVNKVGLKLMVHISFWFMLMMIIYWAEVYIL
jgi:hypothetical protein